MNTATATPAEEPRDDEPQIETSLTYNDQEDFRCIAELMSSGMESIQKACELLVRKLDGGFSLPKIAEVTGLTPTLLGNMERIGRKQMVASLLYDASLVGKRIQKLPYSEQKRLIMDKAPVDVLIMKDGAPEILPVSVDALTPLQVHQVFSHSTIRTTSQQRAWLEAERQKAPVKSNGLPYTPEDHGIRIHGPCYLSYRELRKIMARAESKNREEAA